MTEAEVVPISLGITYLILMCVLGSVAGWRLVGGSFLILIISASIFGLLFFGVSYILRATL